jgi:hypothetical protein
VASLPQQSVANIADLAKKRDLFDVSARPAFIIDDS